MNLQMYNYELKEQKKKLGHAGLIDELKQKGFDDFTINEIINKEPEPEDEVKKLEDEFERQIK